MFLMESTRGRLLVLGVNPFPGVNYTGFVDGDCLWNLSLGQSTGDGTFDGETFFGRLCVIFFLGGRGRRRGNSRSRSEWFVFLDDTSLQTTRFILYIIY